MFHLGIYFFVSYVTEIGQTITFFRNLFRLDFCHRNTSALSVSHHKRKLEALSLEVMSCTRSSVFTFCLFIFGNERTNGCLLKIFSVISILAYLLKDKNCPTQSVCTRR